GPIHPAAPFGGESMTGDLNCCHLDLFCRIYVQADMPHDEFAALVARCSGGARPPHTARSPGPGTSRGGHDVYDGQRRPGGEDSGLYFRYTLEIDPAGAVEPGAYVAAVSRLLSGLWDAGLDAVAACEFEELLPKNERRLAWQASANENGERT